MIEKVWIDASYYTNTCATVELPEGKTWADVEQCYIKWDNLYIKFRNDNNGWHEFRLGSDPTDGTDWKRPANFTVYATDEDGYADYGHELHGG